MRKRNLALLLCGLVIASAFAGCNFLKPGGFSGNQPAETEVPLPPQTEPPAGGSLEDYVILINNTEGTVERVYISANDEEFWGEPLDIPEIMNGASYKIRSFGKEVASYDTPIDFAFTAAGYDYFCSARGLEIKPGDRVRLMFRETGENGGVRTPVFEVTHADGSIHAYEGSLKISVDGTDRKAGG